MTFDAALILSEDEWEIACPIGQYVSELAAEQALKSARAWFDEIEGHACLLVTLGERTIHVFNDQVTIVELNDAAKERLAQPLDMRVPGNHDIAVTALLDRDATYMVEESDFAASTKGLHDFLVRYGPGYRPDHIANKVSCVTAA